MKISILISSYNKGKYIRECIQSCIAQNTANFEIILLDNYSTDETDLILQEYSSKIKIFKSKKISNYPAKNQIDLLQKGLDHSSGDIICLLDADDYFQKNKLSEVRKFFTENKSKDVFFDLPMIKKSEKKFKKFINRKKIQKKIWPTIIPSSSISMRKNFFKDCANIGLFSNYNSLEIDFRINVYSRVIKKNDFEISDSSLNIYRKVDGSIMSSHRKFSKFWWEKRLEAHLFMREWYAKNNQSYLTADYLFTKILVNFFNLKKI
jgi:glycosyltransferase involved in cell wall biosynthesis